MKELPILFSTPMVIAINEGRKTMTRRTRGLEKVNAAPNDYEMIGLFHNPQGIQMVQFDHKIQGFVYCKPTYQIGDHIWVKETWSDFANAIRHQIASDVKIKKQLADIIMYKADTAFPKNYKWKSSLFMKKIHARLWLEVINVGCERLQLISHKDALLEGVKFVHGNDFTKHFNYVEKEYQLRYPSHSFFTLWRSINGNDSVAANPWVWVYEFKLITK